MREKGRFFLGTVLLYSCIIWCTWSVNTQKVTYFNNTAGTVLTAIFNAPNNIDFPMLGRLKDAGLTKKTKDEITPKLEDKKLLFDSIISVPGEGNLVVNT